MSSRKLFLGGLTKSTTTEQLFEVFSRYGLVVDAVVMERNGVPRGFGFVTFKDESSLGLVLADRVKVDGREVDIKRAVPEEEMEHVPTKVFVGGLPQKVDRTMLKQHFSRYGDVRDCVVMMDRTTGRSRGFGFVRFSSPEAVHAVLSAPQVLEGQVVDCKQAQPAEMLPPPKNPRTRGEEQAQPDLSEWLQLFAQPQLFDWSQYGAGFDMWDPSMGMGMGLDQPYFDPSWFDPTAAAFAPTAFEYEAHVPEMPELTMPEAGPSPLGDVSNRLLGAAKKLGEANAAPKPLGENKNPLGDLSNLLKGVGEKRGLGAGTGTGFSAALKAAMKTEASSVASLAFGQ